MSDDQKPGPSTLTCALVGLGGAAVVFGGLHLLSKSKSFGALRDAPEGRPLLGCAANELEPGDEFSVDVGDFSVDERRWRTTVSVADDPQNEEGVIINARDDNGHVETLHLGSRQHVLLERYWPKKVFDKMRGEYVEVRTPEAKTTEEQRVFNELWWMT